VPHAKAYKEALLLASRDRLTEAMAALEVALAIAPDAPALLNKRAQFARRSGADADVEAWLLRSDAADPEQPPVLLELARIAQRRGDVARARALMLSGAPLATRLPGRIGWELRLVIQGGLRILDRIERAGYDVFRRRPKLGKRDYPGMAWRALRM